MVAISPAVKLLIIRATLICDLRAHRYGFRGVLIHAPLSVSGTYVRWITCYAVVHSRDGECVALQIGLWENVPGCARLRVTSFLDVMGTMKLRCRFFKLYMY